jgi:hypothetical protein
LEWTNGQRVAVLWKLVSGLKINGPQQKCQGSALMADQMDGEAYSEEELFRGFVLERILNEGSFS